MCPACIGNAALFVTGAVSASGWTMFALRQPRAASRRRQAPAQIAPPATNDDREAAAIKESQS